MTKTTKIAKRMIQLNETSYNEMTQSLVKFNEEDNRYNEKMGRFVAKMYQYVWNMSKFIGGYEKWTAPTVEQQILVDGFCKSCRQYERTANEV